MIGGGRQAGVPSWWTVTPLPGQMGGGVSCKEIEKRRQRVNYGAAVRDRSRGREKNPEHDWNRWGRRNRISVIISNRT